jgi:hypothetical protein
MPKKPSRTAEQQLLWDLVGSRETYQQTCRMLCVRALALGMPPDTVRRIMRESIVHGLDPNDLKRAGMALEMADSMLDLGKARPS